MSGFFSFRLWAFSWKEMPKLRFGLLLSFESSRTGTGDGCLFLLEPRAFDLKPIKIKVGSAASTGHGLKRHPCRTSFLLPWDRTGRKL